MTEIQLVQTRIGTPKPIGKDTKHADVYSSIDRQPTMGSEILLTWTGLAGDQPTDTRAKSNGGQMHGGHDKAVYVYPVEHYATWRQIIGKEGIGGRSFGENFRVLGALEPTVHIGDIWRIGQVELEVSKVRTPCKTLAIYYRRPNIIRMMFEYGLCGWYLQVKKTGLLPTEGFFEVEPNPSGQTVAAAFATKRQKD